MPSVRGSLLPVLLLAASLSPAVQAQQGPPPPGWVPPSVEALAQHATFHTNFTFDRSMLRFANNFMDSGDEATKNAAAKLDSISVHVFHYSAPGMYDPALLSAIRSDYDATGWKHMVTKHAKGDPFSSGETDLWISFSHMHATGMAIMLVEPRDIEVIGIIGDLSPLDLLHLRGHFGIPKFDADGLSAAPAAPAEGANAQPYQKPSAAPPPPPQASPN